jgi:hypothetical protein
MDLMDMQRVVLSVVVGVWVIANLIMNLNTYFGEPDKEDRLYTGISTLGFIFFIWAVYVFKNW